MLIFLIIVFAVVFVLVFVLSEKKSINRHKKNLHYMDKDEKQNTDDEKI